MKISYIISFILTIIALGLPIYGLRKKIRTKIVVSTGSAYAAAWGALMILYSADMTADKFRRMEDVAKFYPILDKYYQVATILIFVSFAINLYYLAKPIRD